MSGSKDALEDIALSNDCSDDVLPTESSGGATRVLTIVNRKGLHARATAKFVQLVETFNAEVSVSRCGETVGGTSIMGILTLGAGIGTTITVGARGPQALAALDAISALVAARFGEDD